MSSLSTSTFKAINYLAAKSHVSMPVKCSYSVLVAYFDRPNTT